MFRWKGRGPASAPAAATPASSSWKAVIPVCLADIRSVADNRVQIFQPLLALRTHHPVSDPGHCRDCSLVDGGRRLREKARRPEKTPDWPPIPPGLEGGRRRGLSLPPAY